MVELPQRLIEELSSIQWREPWWCFCLESDTTGQNLTIEFQREVAKIHELYPYRDTARAIASRGDQDDVLFWLPGDRDRFAVVHLTWRGSPEPYPGYPNTVVYESLADFVRLDLIPTCQEWAES